MSRFLIRGRKSDVARAGARTLSTHELREIVLDPSELKKGLGVYERGGLEHLARYQHRLFAEAAGIGASPYKVDITFREDGTVKARCSCMAARTRPFCKHGAGLLVAWARAPESFVVAETAPAEIGRDGQRKGVKQGRIDAKALIAAGVAQTATLVRELAVAGMALAGSGRAEQMRELAQSLRENRLRRLSARTLELATLVEQMAKGAISPIVATDLVADMFLTVRKLERHLAGEPLEPRHEEELIGRTWRKSDRAPIADLALLEYSFGIHTTADKFVIHESRFLDLRSGRHFAQKQILPAFLAKRNDAKPSFIGQVLAVATASAYPGYAPTRIELAEVAGEAPLDTPALERLLEVSLTTVGEALASYQETKQDVFAPDRVPVSVRVDTLLADGARLLAVDADDHALYLRDDAALHEQITTLLSKARLRAILGDVTIESALPTLHPRALVIENDDGLELTTIRTTPPLASSEPVAVRRQAGSAAAISLAEIRDELASGFVGGLASVDAPSTRPLVLRLNELGLTKPAALLEALALRPDPESRLDDFVKIYQVLEIALIRLLAATPVERSSLIAVPTFQSIMIRRPETMLLPREVARLTAKRELSRFESAVHLGYHYERMPPEELARSVFPIWADGSAQPFVVLAMKARGDDAIDAAAEALRGHAGRVARLTAILVLGAVGGVRAERLLSAAIKTPGDPVLSRRAAVALRGLTRASGSAHTPIPSDSDASQPAAWCHMLERASLREDRVRAAHELGQLGDEYLIPPLRYAFLTDNSSAVRAAAAQALGRALDLGQLDNFIYLVGDRARSAAEAKAAALALGDLGDARGLEVLLEAWASGWKPTVVAAALEKMGRVALDRLLDFVEAHPELAAKKAALVVLEVNSPTELSHALLPRVTTASLDRAQLYLRLASVHAESHAAIARRVLEVVAAGDDPVAKKARRAAEKILKTDRSGRP